jgi:hypothetical protein
MADCPRCHAPLKPGAFACGVCGLTVGASPADGGKARHAGRSVRTRWIAIGSGLVVVVAVLVAWQVFVREPATTGDEFIGTWRSQSMQSIGSASVSHWGDAFEVRLTSGQTGEHARVTAHRDGASLVITPDDFGASGDATAGRLKLLLGLVAGDFRITLTSADPTHLVLRLTGTSPAGKDVNERAVLEKVIPTPAPT